MEEKNENLKVVTSPEKSKKPDEKRSFWHINKKLLPYKLNYFLFSGGGGTVYPFIPAFGITVLGLTASNIAACYTATLATLFVLKPAIGYTADYFNRLKAVIVGLAVLKTVFCFFIINIPNTGMPGIHTAEFTNTSQNNAYCQLCFNSGTFEILHPKRYLDKEKFEQVSFCFSNNVIQTTLINCPSKYINSINSTNNSFKISQTKCNLPYEDSVLTKPYEDSILTKRSTASKDVHDNDDSLDILYIKKDLISFVCLLPIGRLFDRTNFSSHDLVEYCYTLSNESIIKLQYLFEKLGFIKTDCNDMHKISLQQEDEHTIGIANFKTYQFWAFVICVVMASTFGSAEFTMADTACYESVQCINFGQQRVWSAIGWGLTASFAGYLNDYTKSYMAAWCVLACLTTLEVCNLCRMNLVKPHFSQNILKDMKTIFSSMEFLCFSAGILLNGIFTGIVWFYLPWFIVSIGGNKLIIGLAHTIQCFFGEVPAFYFSGWLIKKFGHFNLVSLALISYGIRFFFYSYLHNPWWILPMEWLQGFSYGTFIPAMTSYGKLNSKPGTEATTQSILCTTYEALGCGIGCLVTGVCLENFGGHTTFFYASFFCVIATMINGVFTFVFRYRKSSHGVTKSAACAERY